MKPQTVVVTGASAGIGRAVAEAFGARGATVGPDRPRRGRPGRAPPRTSRRPAGRPSSCRPTWPTPTQVFAAVDQIEAEVAPIDVWVNVAFTSVFSPFDEITPEEFRRVTEVTYLGYVYATMAALRADEGRATAARSCRSARRWPTAASRCRRRTAAPSTRSRASTRRCAASCCTRRATCT